MVDVKAAVAAVVQGMTFFSSWLFILACYSNAEPIPPVVWGVAVALGAKYGIELVGPAMAKAAKSYFTKEGK